jgi:2-dehydro-3-deoxy-D-arabinonate dehydratase
MKRGNHLKLYRTTHGIVVEQEDNFFAADVREWDDLLSTPGLYERAAAWCSGTKLEKPNAATLLAPVGTQEIWAAGVTYYRSRSARIEESSDAGGGTFYDRVYLAVRPELFFKSNGARAIASGGNVRIRSDAKWSVPEPELTLVINAAGEIVGYTVGNDMSSRDIEGENPLYLPQAKMYDGSCALGPCVLLAQEPITRETMIEMVVMRGSHAAFSGKTTLVELKREPKELVEFLFRETSFPQGVYLMTGTGIVPGNDFTLANGDVIRITIEGIGTLENTVV